MKYIRWILVIICTYFSFDCCLAQKGVNSSAKLLGKDGQLNEEQQRKFDFFFYEASREKMLGNLDRSSNYFIECLKIDARSSASLFELANIYLTGNQTIKAIGLLEKAVTLNPDNIWYSYLLAEIYKQTGNTNKAIELFNRLVESTNENEEYLYEAALLYAKEKKYDEALQTLNKIEKKIGLNEQITLEKQKLYLQQGKVNKAIHELEILIKREPNNVRYYGYLGDIYLLGKQFDFSEKNYRRVLEIDPNYHLIFFSLANLYLQKGDTISFKSNFNKGLVSSEINIEFKLQKLAPFVYGYKKSPSIYSKLEIDSLFKKLIGVHEADQRLLYIYGQFLKDEKEQEMALYYMNRAIQLDEGNEPLWQDILFIQLELEQYDQLIASGKQALKSFPENALIYLLLSSALLQKNMPIEAIRCLKQGIPHCGDNNALKGQLYTVLGDSYYSENNSDSAFYYYEEALKLNDKNLVVLNNYGYYLALEGKDLAKAEQMSSKCVEFEPGNSTYLDTYAWILFKRSRFFEAKFIIERAIDNGGSVNGVIVEHYGDILYFNNDIDGAVREWIKAREINSVKSGLLERKILNRQYFEK